MNKLGNFIPHADDSYFSHVPPRSLGWKLRATLSDGSPSPETTSAKAGSCISTGLSANLTQTGSLSYKYGEPILA